MQKLLQVLIGVLILAFVSFAAFHYFSAVQDAQQQACTTEAKICPDGSAVGRTGPDCAFALCPEATTTPLGGGGGIVAFKSGIRGVVLVGPTCPVVHTPPEPGCADKPYVTSISIYHAGSDKPFITDMSAADGTFSYALPPGDYTVTPRSGDTLPRCASVSVTVPPAAYATTTIVCDSGIR